MRLALKLAAGCAILVAAPASAQILGGSGGGGLGGSLGGNLGGTLSGPARDVTGRLGGATDAKVDREVDRRSGRANARARGNARGDGAVDALGRSATLGGSASGDAGAGAQAVGTDRLRGTVQNVRGTTRGTVDSARGTARGAVGNLGNRAGSASASGSGSASGAFQGGAGQLAAAGSAAATTAGAISVSPGMIVRDTSGRAIGRVQAVRARANGMIDHVVVRAGDRLATLPDDNFSASGNVLVSAMGEADVRRMSRGQQTAQSNPQQRSWPAATPSSSGRHQEPRNVDKH